MSFNQEAAQAAISKLIDPWLGQDWVSAKAIKAIRFETGTLGVKVVLGYPFKKQHLLAEQLRKTLIALPGVNKVDIEITFNIVSHAVRMGLKSIPRVKNIIAVGSGKGGVGKSTTAVNVALALANQGAKVGVLDADIYGPNQPQMLGVNHKAAVTDSKRFKPIIAHNLQTMSIGYLIDPHQAMIWRGPMVSRALQQLLEDTDWEPLDYLILDLPPGTGDIQLTMAQKVPVSGAIIVTTPQDVALLDARKAIGMFHKVEVPVLGLVENMSLHTCTQCGYVEPIFGEKGGKQLAKDSDILFLGQLPLSMSIRERADQGSPTVIADPTSDIAGYYTDIAIKTVAALSLRPKNYAAKFPNIVVE